MQVLDALLPRTLLTDRRDRGSVRPILLLANRHLLSTILASPLDALMPQPQSTTGAAGETKPRRMVCVPCCVIGRLITPVCLYSRSYLFNNIDLQLASSIRHGDFSIFPDRDGSCATLIDGCLPPLATSTSIRLIELQGGEHESDISMSINSYDLLDPPQYAAFSYTWGGPTFHPYLAERPSVLVHMDNKPILVTRNLYDLLNHWRGWRLEIETATILLWVDALCINQDDVLERNHQVGLMGRIYNEAPVVMTWVGTPDDDAWTAFKLIHRLRPIVELWLSEKSNFKYFYNSDKLFEISGVDAVTPDEWGALISFFERQYFSRAWIVQEVALARAVFMMLGHYFIEWNYLVNLSRMLANCGWIPVLQRYAKSSISDGSPRLHLGAPAVYSRIRSHCRQYRARERDQAQDIAKPDAKASYVLLELLIYQTRWFRATNPRDHIYSVLSIVSHTCGISYPTADLLSPDYCLSVRRVFIDVTSEIALNTGSASVLSLVDRDAKEVPDLPSWVPDYSASRIDALAYLCDARLYQAFSMVPRSPDITIVEEMLSLSATRMDTITEMEVPRPGGSFLLQGKLDLCLQHPKLYFNGQTRTEALWRTIIADTDGEQSPAPEATGYSFRQYVLLAVVIRVRNLLEGWDGRPFEVHDFVSLIKLNNNYDEPSDPWLPRAQEVESFWLMFQAMQNEPQKAERSIRKLEQKAHIYMAAVVGTGGGRRLFVTSGNLFGLAPESAKCGDTIWFVPGSRVPFVLRRCGDEQYTLVGEAYLHGYMHGELGKYSMPLQSTCLV